MYKVYLPGSYTQTKDKNWLETPDPTNDKGIMELPGRFITLVRLGLVPRPNLQALSDHRERRVPRNVAYKRRFEGFFVATLLTRSMIFQKHVLRISWRAISAPSVPSGRSSIHPADAWESCWRCSAQRITSLERMLRTIKPPTRGKTVPL